jgi:hypothetical protein
MFLEWNKRIDSAYIKLATRLSAFAQAGWATTAILIAHTGPSDILFASGGPPVSAVALICDAPSRQCARLKSAPHGNHRDGFILLEFI